jgi:polar amino acid transport system substrate-binding protein
MVLGVVLAAASAQAVQAQATIPSFNDARQRVAKPDLSTIPRLRFLTTTDFFPFNFLDGDGVLGGFHIDLARAICRELDLLDRCQIQALPFEELEEALARGEGEALIAGLAITEESRSSLLFSRPYLKFPARFVVRREAPLEEPIYRALPGRRVGVLEGTAHERMLRDFFPRAEAVPLTESAELMDALREAKVDAVFGDGMRLGFWLAGEEGRACCAFAGGSYLAPEYLGQGLAIAVPRDQPLLAGAINYALQEVDAQGTFAELYLRYFPVSFY